MRKKNVRLLLQGAICVLIGMIVYYNKLNYTFEGIEQPGLEHEFGNEGLSQGSLENLELKKSSMFNSPSFSNSSPSLTGNLETHTNSNISGTFTQSPSVVENDRPSIAYNVNNNSSVLTSNGDGASNSPVYNIPTLPGKKNKDKSQKEIGKKEGIVKTSPFSTVGYSSGTEDVAPPPGPPTPPVPLDGGTILIIVLAIIFGFFKITGLSKNFKFKTT